MPRLQTTRGAHPPLPHLNCVKLPNEPSPLCQIPPNLHNTPARIEPTSGTSARKNCQKPRPLGSLSIPIKEVSMTRQPASYLLTFAVALFIGAALRADTPLPTSKPAATSQSAATAPTATQPAAAPD